MCQFRLHCYCISREHCLFVQRHSDRGQQSAEFVGSSLAAPGSLARTLVLHISALAFCYLLPSLIFDGIRIRDVWRLS